MAKIVFEFLLIDQSCPIQSSSAVAGTPNVGDWAAKPAFISPGSDVFQRGRADLSCPLFVNWVLDRGHAHDGGVRNRQIARGQVLRLPFVR